MKINKELVWKGKLENNTGMVGLLCAKHSVCDAREFSIVGNKQTASIDYLYTELLQGAGNKEDDWTHLTSDPLFYYGEGVESKLKNARAKLNFIGANLSIFAPKKYKYGKIKIIIDGKQTAIINLKSNKDTKSEKIFESKHLKSGRHAVVIESISDIMPIDFVKVQD